MHKDSLILRRPRSFEVPFASLPGPSGEGDSFRDRSLPSTKCVNGGKWERGKRKEESGKRKVESGKRKEERGKSKLKKVLSVTKQGFVL